MDTFTPHRFDLSQVSFLSEENKKEHVLLYAAYVANANMLLQKLHTPHTELDAYTRAELGRRFSFEFCGMKNHEHYFGAITGAPVALSETSLLYLSIAQTWGSYTAWKEHFTLLAKTRGVGWAILYYDTSTKKLLTQWVDEQHLGHLIGCTPLLCLDMWEHAYVYDYPTSNKHAYIEAFFEALNWNHIEQSFIQAH
jgi:superoxide dismutase, Fe-Mn family